ncbi:MAG TPA: addiction module protein [Tepidisphaeraceae bacterium]|nr:addiction module protein [Tepidisphaeraceae bacterium]
MTLDTLIQEARKLSPAEQAELLDALILLVGPDSSDVALTPAQQGDLDRRVEEYRAGKAKMLDGDEAFARLRKRA